MVRDRSHLTNFVNKRSLHVIFDKIWMAKVPTLGWLASFWSTNWITLFPEIPVCYQLFFRGGNQKIRVEFSATKKGRFGFCLYFGSFVSRVAEVSYQHAHTWRMHDTRITTSWPTWRNERGNCELNCLFGVSFRGGWWCLVLLSVSSDYGWLNWIRK